jgi:hypothetical protein
VLKWLVVAVPAEAGTLGILIYQGLNHAPAEEVEPLLDTPRESAKKGWERRTRYKLLTFEVVPPAEISVSPLSLIFTFLTSTRMC